jgi:ubiquinone/menaquinone biosynthesis C-methylase UbiE
MFKKTLQKSYSLLAPIYDSFVDIPTRAVRQRSLEQLGDVHGKNILLCGIGTGLDIPYLPAGAHYTGIDFAYQMLKRVQKRITTQDISLHLGDVMQLPYPDQHFDIVIMHLILTVTPFPQRALSEANRVRVHNGKLLILDKFLKKGQIAPVRRLFSPLIGKLATRTDVVFEELNHPGLMVQSDTPALAWGWFRHILLQKENGHGSRKG